MRLCNFFTFSFDTIFKPEIVNMQDNKLKDSEVIHIPQASSLPWLQDQLASSITSPGLLARLSLLALCRGAGQEQEQEQGTLVLLQQCAVHPDTEIRAAAISAICQVLNSV